MTEIQEKYPSDSGLATESPSNGSKEATKGDVINHNMLDELENREKNPTGCSTGNPPRWWRRGHLVTGRRDITPNIAVQCGPRRPCAVCSFCHPGAS